MEGERNEGYIAQNNKDDVDYDIKTNPVTNSYAIYVPGVGTSRTQSKIAQIALGSGIEKRIIVAYDYILSLLGIGFDQAKVDQFQLKIFGFSRGAATARMFSTYISQYGFDARNSEMIAALDGLSSLEETFLKETPTFPSTTGLIIKIAFLGLFDTVLSVYFVGGYKISLDIPANVYQCFHAVATAERRKLFNYTPIQTVTENWVESFHLGSHADIGGFEYIQRQFLTVSDMVKFGRLQNGLQDLEQEPQTYQFYSLFVPVNPESANPLHKRTVDALRLSASAKLLVTLGNLAIGDVCYYQKINKAIKHHSRRNLLGIEVLPPQNPTGQMIPTQSQPTTFICILIDASSIETFAEYELQDISGSTVINGIQVDITLNSISFNSVSAEFNFDATSQTLTAAAMDSSNNQLECHYGYSNEELRFENGEEYVKEGQSVKCSSGGNPSDTYRYTDDKLRRYPSVGVANSWDNNWRLAGATDCSEMEFGNDMLHIDSAEEDEY